MSTSTAIAIYFLIWWVTLFAVLPWGISNQEESGEVVPGTGIGKKFTFPTMNLRPEQELLPAKGVYITRTVLEGETRSRRSLTNVGRRPTFNGTGLTVETHLLDYSGDVTAKRIEVRFWKRLREEKKFS